MDAGYNIKKFALKSEQNGGEKFWLDEFPLSEIQELVLDNCSVIHRAVGASYSVENLANLTSLSLVKTYVHPDFLTNFKQLENLEKFRVTEKCFYHLSFSTVFSTLGHHVKDLEIGSNSKDRSTVIWNKIPSNCVEDFTLINCDVKNPDNVSGYSMKQFPHLKSLSLLDTKIESSFLEKLHELTNLESVGFIGKEVSAPFLVISANFGLNVKRLDLSKTDIGIIYGSSELLDILSLTPNIVELTLNGCAHLQHDVFLGLPRDYSHICPNLRRITAKETCLTQTSLPEVWRVNGVVIIVDC